VLFNSFIFLLFFIVTYALFRLSPGWRTKKVVLLVASYVFYGSWNPPFVLLLVISTVVDFFAAQIIHRSNRKPVRVLFVIVSAMTNLGILGFFKYADFMIANLDVLSQWFGGQGGYHPLKIILPIGISFYTFQTMSYTIDVYRRRYEPTGSFLNFALYVTFFPQLVAGPIVRADQFLPQCQSDTSRKVTAGVLTWAAFLFAYGLFRKMVIADNMAPVVEAIYARPEGFGFFDCWVATYAFAIQIFCDFSGYSLMAIGLALAMGFHVPGNFRCPYGATGLRDFWRRWHVSLSTWLRDYLYIPLGGNRRGRPRMVMAVMLTMLLGGLWHGAAWNFVIWGGLHGLYLLGERALSGKNRQRENERPARLGLGGLVRIVVVFHLVCLTWVFFRSPDLDNSLLMVRRMLLLDRFNYSTTQQSPLTLALVLGTAALMVGWHTWRRNRTLEQVAERIPAPVLAVVTGALFVAAILLGAQSIEFIYFQF